MDDLLSRWLGLREAADARARSEWLTRTIAVTLPAGGEPVHVLDLATGTGSNVRYLSPRLPSPQRWLAVDRRADLLAELRGRTAGLTCEVDTREGDLGALDDPAIFAGRHLVTASALLDLVSEPWLQSVAARCRAERASALFTITYNGRSSCDPVDPDDHVVLQLFNQHQRRDKGLGGPATGPGGAQVAERSFTQAGYRVICEPSDWMLGPADADMQRMLIDGWAEAGAETDPEQTDAIAAWRVRRLAHVDRGCSRIRVGHDELAAWLPADGTVRPR